MKWKKPGRPSAPLAASIGAGLLLLLLFLSYLFSSGLLNERDGIMLSTIDENETALMPIGSALTAQSVADVTITAQNARNVIASLSRPAHYSCKVENALHYSGGSSMQRTRCYVRDGVVRIDTVSENDEVQSSIIHAGDDVYAWEATDNMPYHGAWGDFSDEAAAMMPSYADVLADGIVVSEASRVDIDDEPCIRVIFEQGGYRCAYAVSAVSGLLREASFYSGDTLVRQTVVSELSTVQPEESIFTLPYGRSLLGEE